MSNKTEKIKELIAFMKANPGQSNRWYAENNKIVSERTFFNYLKKGMLGAAGGAASGAASGAGGTTPVSNETTPVSNETHKKEWWEEEEEPSTTDILKEAGITPIDHSFSFEKQNSSNVYFENDDPVTARKKLREMEYERKRAEAVVKEEKRRASSGEYTNYEDCKNFLKNHYFTHEKTKSFSIRQHIQFFLNNPTHIRNPRPEWFSRFLAEEGYDRRPYYKVLEEVNRVTNEVLDEIRLEKVRTTLKNSDCGQDKVLEHLLQYVPAYIKKDNTLFEKAVRNLKNEIKKMNVTMEKCLLSPDSARCFVQVVYTNGSIKEVVKTETDNEEKPERNWKDIEGDYTIDNDEEGNMLYEEIKSKVDMGKIIAIKPCESLCETDVDRIIGEYDKLNSHGNIKQNTSFIAAGTREWI